MIDFSNLAINLLTLEAGRLLQEDEATLSGEKVPAVMLKAASFCLGQWSAAGAGDGPSAALGYAVAAEAESEQIEMLRSIPPLTELVARLTEQTIRETEGAIGGILKN